jgi:hypothetical protein
MLKSQKAKDTASVTALPASDAPSLAELAAKAQTASEHEAVVKRLDAEIDHEQGVLNTLDRKREAKAMEGTAALREHVHAMRVQREVIEALEEAHAKAVERLDVARKREATAALEAKVAATHAEHDAAYEAAVLRTYAAAWEMLDAFAEMERHEGAIALINWEAERADRLDLVKSPKVVWQKVLRSLAPERPARLQGEVKRGPNESDEGFRLRRSNRLAEEADFFTRSHDPFKVIGEKVRREILRFFIEPHEKPWLALATTREKAGAERVMPRRLPKTEDVA